MNGKVPGPGRLAVALVVAAVLAVVGLAGCGGSGDTTASGSDDGDVDTASITLPDEIDGDSEIVAALEAGDGSKEAVDAQKANQEKVAAATAESYSAAFGGAGAAYRQYADAELTRITYVIAVRAEAPGMVIGPVLDPEYLGLVKAEREVQSVGEVECQVVNTPTVAGGDPDPSSVLTTNCQRVGSGVSVFVGSSDLTGPGGLKRLAGFTEAAWKSVAEA